MTSTSLLMRVVHWDTNFERAGSRSTDRCGYVCLPNNPGTIGMMNVLDEYDGAALLGVYDLLIRRLSKQRRPDPVKEPQAAVLYYRDGWLTENGKKDGAPISLYNLSRAFRRPMRELLRMVKVMTSEGVGWIEIVSGSETFEYEDEEGAERQLTIGSSEVEKSQSLSEKSLLTVEKSQSLAEKSLLTVEKSQSLAEKSQGIPTKDIKERKESKERKVKSAREDDLEIKNPGIGMDEARQRLTVIARKPRFAKYLTVTKWSYKLDQQLAAALAEISREDLEYVEWCYLLDPSDPFFEKFFPRKSFESLIENLPAEPQKIRAARRELGMNGLHEPSQEKRKEPGRWRELYRWVYNDPAITLPATFWLLPSDKRVIYEQRFDEFAAANPEAQP